MFTYYRSECSFDFAISYHLIRKGEKQKAITFIDNQLKAEYYEFEV